MITLLLLVLALPPAAPACGSAIAPSPDARHIVVEGERVWRLVTVPPGATAVSCDGLTTVDVRASGGRTGQRRDLRLDIAKADGRRWSVRAGDLRSFTIAVPRGSYRVEASSPHFVRATKTIAADGKPLQLALELNPLPVIRGTVMIRAGDQPMTGASVTTDTDDTGGTLTDAAGRFALEVDPERWPEMIIVRAVPFADAAVPVPAARADTQLDPVWLSAGRTITVQVEQTVSGQVRTLELRKIVRGKYAGATVATLDVPAAETAPTLTFGNVEPGTYVVLARGEKPWQQRGDRIDVESDVTVCQRIEPFQLKLAVRFDGEALAGADLVLMSLTGYWDDKLQANDDGSAELELWQVGSYQVHLVPGTLSAPYIERRTIASAVNQTWTIDIPARAIAGVVVDARSGQPVPAAAVSLKVIAGTADGMLAFNVTADERGEFRLVPVRHGRHVLSAGAVGYAPSETTYWFGEPEQSRNVTVRLERASRVRVQVLDHRGMPVAGARAMQFRGGIRMEGHSDAAGILDEVPVPDDGPADLYLVPRDGSFAHHVLTAAAPETVVRVAEGASRIVLRAVTDRGDPLPGVTMVIRYNGWVMPPELLEAVALLQGRRPRTNAQGEMVLDRMPAGVYEFWPAGSFAEVRAAAAGLTGEAPARLVVVPGDNVAVMRFERTGASP